jgi:6-phosphogluconate dehydrogenase
MGKNLAINFVNSGEVVVVYNRSIEKSRALAEQYPGNIIVAERYQDLVSLLPAKKRRVIVLVAGSAKDEVLTTLYSTVLEDGDVLMDFGNSYYADTEAHQRKALERGVHLLSVGISGGEEGARTGASLMIGGDRRSYDLCRPLFQTVAARHDGEACELYTGPGASGQFVKMVHNGIEYGLMQVIAEVYETIIRLNYSEVSERLFQQINSRSMLHSFLLEIVPPILGTTNPLSPGMPVINCIDDAANQKGTGRWTVSEGVNLGVPVPTLSAALTARVQSALSGERALGGSQISGDVASADEVGESIGIDQLANELVQATELAFLVCYDQGFRIMRDATKDSTLSTFSQEFDLPAIAKVWRAGCIIRTALLPDIAESCSDATGSLLLSPVFADFVAERLAGLRSLVILTSMAGIPAPALSSALTYIDTLRSGRLEGAALIQCMRDYFGAHGVTSGGSPLTVTWNR